MNFRSPKREDLNGRKLPDSIHASVVASLYNDPRSLIIGTICAGLAPVVIFWKTNDPLQLAFALLFLISGVIRLIASNTYNRAAEGQLSRIANEKWETAYTWLGGGFVGLLGIWYISSIYVNEDPFVQLLTLVLSTAHLTGLIGRNFSSAKVIQVQGGIMSFCLVSGTLISGDVYHVILAAFMVPFLIAVRLMCTHLREMLFRSELNALDNSVIANRFDVALDNVTHGIAMFDHEGKIVVANHRFTELVGFIDWDILDCDVSILTAAKILGNTEKTLAAQIKNCLESSESQRFTFENSAGQVIESDYSAMPNGGVILLADVSARRASEREILELANFDPLTNLPNRRYFVEEIGRQHFTPETGLKPCAMFFIDLDKFKEVNDTLGHGVGDKLLKTIAARLNVILPKGGLSCRFGGDEFVVLVPGKLPTEKCSEFAKSIITELSMPVLIDNNQINVGASVGVALAPTDANHPELLLQYADAALYEAKAAGRGVHVFYDDAIGEALRLRRELEIDLKRAIADDTLELFYQPLINLKAGKVSTCEALLRWDHPVHGRISPAKFIPIAEESGLIVELGEYVLRKAMNECMSWQSGTRVAVNVSTIQFHKSDIIGIVSDLLEETKLPPENLEIEITESAMMDNIKDVTRSLNALSSLGVRISLDDFGTGFSNLSYLHALPFDKVKIDKSFIENAIANDRSLTLLKGVVDLIKRLQLSVVLEGIENEAQIEILSNHLAVDEVQGFLFGRPMPSRDVAKVVNTIGYKRRDAAQPLIA